MDEERQNNPKNEAQGDFDGDDRISVINETIPRERGDEDIDEEEEEEIKCLLF